MKLIFKIFLVLMFFVDPAVALIDTNAKTAIIIPAFNEANTIANVITSALTLGDVIVVNDCSEDNTKEKIVQSEAILIDNEVNLGYEKSIAVGLRYALDKSYVFAIIGAEYILRWLPIGTHDWEKFVKPADLKNILSKNNLKIEKIDGMNFNIFKDEWSISKDTSINYIAKSLKI